MLSLAASNAALSQLSAYMQVWNQVPVITMSSDPFADFSMPVSAALSAQAQRLAELSHAESCLDRMIGVEADLLSALGLPETERVAIDSFNGTDLFGWLYGRERAWVQHSHLGVSVAGDLRTLRDMRLGIHRKFGMQRSQLNAMNGSSPRVSAISLHSRTLQPLQHAMSARAAYANKLLRRTHNENIIGLVLALFHDEEARRNNGIHSFLSHPDIASTATYLHLPAAK